MGQPDLCSFFLGEAAGGPALFFSAVGFFADLCTCSASVSLAQVRSSADCTARFVIVDSLLTPPICTRMISRVCSQCWVLYVASVSVDDSRVSGASAVYFSRSDYIGLPIL